MAQIPPAAGSYRMAGSRETDDAQIWKLEGEVRTLFVLAIWFWLVKPMLEPYLGSLPYANLALATAAVLALLLLPLVWRRKAEVGPT